MERKSNVNPFQNHDIRIATPQGQTPTRVRRSHFPKDFIFGAGTSAYQVCVLIVLCLLRAEDFSFLFLC